MSSSFWDERYAQPFTAFGITPNDFLVSQEAGILQACEVSGGNACCAWAMEKDATPSGWLSSGSK